MEGGFVKGDNTNLPRISSLDFCSAELRNVKTSISGRESYGDDAIGYVQLKREQNICIIKCTVCPEHKVRSKPYAATLLVNEQEEVVTSVKCHGCPASEGGCKHGVAFLMWLYRRNAEPSCTSIECYWKKSYLGKIGTSIKILSARDMAKQKLKEFVQESGLMFEFVTECKKRKINTCQFMKHETDYCVRGNVLLLHNLIINYSDANCERFLMKILHNFNKASIKNAERNTQAQHSTAIWHELRYGRIIASKSYEVSRCKTTDGTMLL